MSGTLELTIGEVARRAGVATSSIRYYERIGLLPEPARSGGQRRYDGEVLGMLGFIGVAQSAGFKLREIRQLMDGTGDLGAPMRSLSSQKLAEIEALLERTKAMKSWLEVAQHCGCATPAECALFPARGDDPAGRSARAPGRPHRRRRLSPAALELNQPRRRAMSFAAQSSASPSRRSTSTQSFHSPSRRPWRRWTPTSRKPAARWAARLAALSVKSREVSL